MAQKQNTSTGEITNENPLTADANNLFVKVYSPFNTYYDGQADSISAENDTGPFDVLLGHHNFLTLLKPCEILIRRKGQDDEKITITRGLMHVKRNQVIVFLDV